MPKTIKKYLKEKRKNISNECICQNEFKKK